MKTKFKKCPKCNDKIKILGYPSHFKYCKGINKNIQHKVILKENYYDCPKCKDSISKYCFTRHLKTCKGIFHNRRKDPNKKPLFIIDKIAIKIDDNLFYTRDGYVVIACYDNKKFELVGFVNSFDTSTHKIYHEVNSTNTSIIYGIAVINKNFNIDDYIVGPIVTIT